MPFLVPIDEAREQHRDFEFVSQLPPSEQKAAFHVRDKAGRELCLKIIAPDYDLDRLKREIEALQLVNHPNVGKLVEYFYSSKNGKHVHYIVEEFIEGSDLAESLVEGKPWPLSGVKTFFISLARGLDALRQVEIVHRDLKPRNIRIRPSGEPVIIDFGLARHLGLPDLTRTSEGAQMGTPSYFAPEQWQGTKHDIDHRTDLFAFGILMHQALIGIHPFWNKKMKNRSQLEQATCESDEFLRTTAFKQLPEDWQLLAAKLLKKTRAQRPHRAEQVVHWLEGIVT